MISIVISDILAVPLNRVSILKRIFVQNVYRFLLDRKLCKRLYSHMNRFCLCLNVPWKVYGNGFNLFSNVNRENISQFKIRFLISYTLRKCVSQSELHILLRSTGERWSPSTPTNTLPYPYPQPPLTTTHTWVHSMSYE